MTAPDDEFEVRLGRIRNRARQRSARGFVGQVLAAANRAGGTVETGRRPRQVSRFGRGGGAAARLLSPARRVLVKARVVRHAGRVYRAAPLATHLAYLRRDGVTQDGSRAAMFNVSADATDHRDFAARCEGDRHHFRFIVSPEDATALADLNTFTRDMMRQAERDLGTRLDWIAVVHWNTDNPHVHVLVRGVTEDGADLVISRDYIARGFRARAEALVALELGPKPEQVIRSALAREIDAERWTRLDAAIRERANPQGWIDLRPHRSIDSDPELRRLMVGRLQHLERYGLAVPDGTARWVLSPDAEPTLRALGERGDIIRTIHRAMRRQTEERGVDAMVVHPAGTGAGTLGRLVATGLHDEAAGEAFAVIDGIDGRVHHLRFAGAEALGHPPPPGGIVEVWGAGSGGAAAPRLGLATRSDLPLAMQVTADGATWLDQQLVGRHRTTFTAAGFGADVQSALAARTDHLIGMGLAWRDGQRVLFARDLLTTLRQRELDAAATQIAGETGLSARPAEAGGSVAGTYRQRLALASGRFAMIEDGLGFQLVPWKPSLERHLGRHVTGTVQPGGEVDWSFGRKRGLGV